MLLHFHVFKLVISPHLTLSSMVMCHAAEMSSIFRGRGESFSSPLDQSPDTYLSLSCKRPGSENS